MRILQVMAGGDHGGAETAFVDMCIAMHEGGMEIEVATRANPVRVPALEAAGIKVHQLPFGGPLDVFTGWKLGQIIKKFQPLIVQTWMGRATQKTPNWKSLKTPQRYLVVSRLGGYYKIRNFKNTDYFNTNTPDLKRYLMDGGIDGHRIEQINNFVDVDHDYIPVHKTDFNIPIDAPVLVTLGRLHRNKAQDILLRAMADVPGAYVLIAGEGEERENLETLARTLGVWERVRFLGWRTDRSALMQMSDICVFPSRAEPFGNVFAQAWAEKLPVIVADAEGPRQFCRDNEDCLMVPKDDPDALAAAINKMLRDKDLQKRLVDTGYQRYLNEFTKEKTVAAYLGFFIESLKREHIL